MAIDEAAGEDLHATQGDRAKPFATECDLVMKGGITSGVVYPLAIVEIARAFRLRSIGGASVGAIAAAAAAAAEVRRQRARKQGRADEDAGFAQLAGLPHLLGEPSPGGQPTHLLALFRPAASLRAIFFAVTGAMAVPGTAGKALHFLLALARAHLAVWIVAFLVAALPLWSLRAGPWAPLAALVAIALAVAVAFAAVLGLAASTLLRELPRNRFGFCSGMPAAGEPAPGETLTAWLNTYIDELAGQPQPGSGDPLTFRDLREHGIDLQMMTTCLTLGRPFRLPFRDDGVVRENNQFWWRPDDFAELFPPNVVRWMREHQRPVASAPEGRSPFDRIDFDGFLRLPAPDDLPVVVAARMSLSFPILLSAVPLYSVDFRRRPATPEPPLPCWFTDGGVGSNFPIHFFDAPLPARPTFGLDLGETADPRVERVVFPNTNRDARLPYWRSIPQAPGLAPLATFLGAIVTVAKDWNHETLSHMPGFRDRIGLVRLTRSEGGLNLTMTLGLITQLSGWGREAGQKFVARFGDPAKSVLATEPPGMDWENHQAVRLRLLLASVAELLAELRLAERQTAGTASDYARFFQGPYGPESYRFTGLGRLGADPVTGVHATQAGLARWVLDQLLETAQGIERSVQAHAGVHPAKDAPKPSPELRPRPRI